MKRKYKVIVRNNKLHYEFEIKRNITIIQGDSATGKTTLINMLRQAENLGESSGVDVLSNVPCRILEGVSWKLILQNTVGTIFFIDEENAFINTEEFAAEVRGSDNYFVLITRENLYNLPYSVEEIYGLYASGRYQNTKKIYQQMYRIYSDIQELPIKPESFEWIVLKSGLIDDREIRKILETPELFIDSKKYFSWERFFTALLIDKTKTSSVWSYTKKKLSKAYLSSKVINSVKKFMKLIKWV